MLSGRRDIQTTNDKTLILAGLVLAFAGCEKKLKQDAEQSGVIGRSHEGGKPVIWRFVNETPAASKRKRLSWLAIIEWKYDGSSNNGMPSKGENERMITLEDELEQQVEKIDFCEHAYSRTGNGVKEFAYYIHDRETFTQALNRALRRHTRYPINITFYKDPEWKELHRLLRDFDKEREQGDSL